MNFGWAGRMDFCLRHDAAGQGSYWDNNRGRNYSILPIYPAKRRHKVAKHAHTHARIGI